MVMAHPINCPSCKYHGIANIGGDKHVCLAEGEIILIDDLEKCPLEAGEEQKELSNEEIARIYNTIHKAYEILAAISEDVAELRKSFDNEDLVALIKGKTGMAKRDIRAVLEAMDKAKKAGKKHALKKFIAAMGNVSLRDVTTVIDEIERLNRKYGGEVDSQ